MPLLTIADLDQPQAVLAPYIQQAQLLKSIYIDYVNNSQDDNFKYTVEVFGSKGRADGIHASEAAGCMRPPVYSLMGTERKPTKIDTNMLMRFNVGKALHAMIQAEWHRIAAKSGGLIRFADEVRLTPELQELAAQWQIHSSCDGEITLCNENLEPQVRIGLEIKTESDGQYEKLKEPRDKHLEQTNIYMAVLDLPLMWTMYYNKSNSSITDSVPPWLFKFNRKMWEENQEMRFAKMHHLAETSALPDRTEGFECGWCPFAWACDPPNQARVKRQSAAPVVINQGMRWKKKP